MLNLRDSMADAEKKQSKKRIFLERAFSTVVLWLIIAGAIVFQNIWLFFVIIGLLGLGALLELLKMMPAYGSRAPHYVAFFIGLAYFIVSFWHVYSRQNSDFFYLDSGLVVVGLFALFFVALGRKPESPEALWRVAGPFFAVAYTALLFSYVTRLIVVSSEGISQGAYYVLFLLVVTKFTDTGAYCTGTLFGKNKMIPRISPGKTWEGFVGALVWAVACAHGLLALLPHQLIPLTHGNVTVIALVLAVVAVLGDLAESVIKRSLQANDSGSVLPGIGGSLDLIDSVLFTAPVFYVILTMFF